jgi:hypothetical protein
LDDDYSTQLKDLRRSCEDQLVTYLNDVQKPLQDSATFSKSLLKVASLNMELNDTDLSTKTMALVTPTVVKLCSLLEKSWITENAKDVKRARSNKDNARSLLRELEMLTARKSGGITDSGRRATLNEAIEMVTKFAEAQQ